MATFNIPELLSYAFGITGYRILNDLTAPSIKYRDIQGIEVSQAAAISALGTPIYDIIRFKGGTIPGTDEIFESLDLRDYPLISVSRQKNILKTQVVGRDGTVNEMISNGNFSVVIRGLLVENDSGKIPIEQARKLQRIADIPASLDVESVLLNTLGINTLVIESYEFPALEGFLNVQPYVLTCFSETPAEAQILNDL